MKEHVRNKMSQSVLITGASGGIGQACAHWFANEGWHVYLQGRDEAKLQQLCNELKQSYSTLCHYYCADLTDSSTIKPLFQQMSQNIKQQESSLSAVVHSAGTMKQASLAMVTEQDIDQQFNLHLKSSLLIAQLASRLMIRKKQGAMVFISSAVASQGAIGQVLYSAAKSGLHGMIKSLAKELGAFNIRVNAVAPGFIETDLVKDYSQQQRQKLAEATCLNKLGQADDVAKAIGFLASESSSYITGQTLPVDAGMSLP